MAADESYPDDLRYHPEHDWARVEGEEATLGVTWFAVDALGELVHFEPPQEGQQIERDGSYGEVESVKAVSDLIAPLSGEVIEVNQKVVDAPETVNDDPYGEGWLVSEFEFMADWPSWEMHPEGDEFVYLLSGEVELTLELPGGLQKVPLRGRGAVVVPSRGSAPRRSPAPA